METREDKVKEALKRAIEAAGNNQSELARRMNAWPESMRAKPYKQQHVSHWLSVGNVPAEHAPAISWAVNGVVSTHDLCPGVFGAAESKAA